MGIIVSKFGGTSMADAGQFEKVRQIVEADSRRRFIILSAPGKRDAADAKITDLLNRAHSLCASGDDPSEPLTEVRQRFAGIIQSLHLDIDPEEFLCTLEQDVRISPDHAASRGEYFCAKLFAAYADMPFMDAARLIRFDEHGRIIPEKIERAVHAMFTRLPYAVIPGFYGSLPDGSIKTFTRGGSDITGALIAAALHADVYENWTDVDGLMSVDPRLCSDAVCHSAVSYRQMRKLANAGAQVLHPYCLEPVCENSVPTVLKNTFAPEKAGTYISDHVRGNIPCISVQEGLRAAELRSLSKEARLIAEGLRADLFISAEGSSLLALHSDSCAGVSSVLVSIFGLPAELYPAAIRISGALGALGNPDCLKLLIESRHKQEAIRLLHAILINK